MKNKLLGLMFAALLLAGCGTAAQPKQTEAPDTAAAETSAEDESAAEAAAADGAIIDTIKDRGYLICGCKMDVPGLGLYDEAADTWSGIEVELAWQTAAGIFGTDIQDAKAKGLVHFEGVTVADRESKLEAGDIDCMIATYTITDERAKRFAISDSYYTDYIGIMVRYTGDNANAVGSMGNIYSIADLDGRYIGVAQNSTTRDDMLAYINMMNTIKPSPIFCVYDSYPALFEALKEEKIDAMSVDVSILNGYVDSETRILDDRFAGQHYGAAVRKGDEALITYINQAIASM